MNLPNLKEHIKGIDIYLLDQILKDRYQPNDKILGAGCGKGRNLKWFYNNNFKIHGIDADKDAIEHCKEIYPILKGNFIQTIVEQTPYEANTFNHVICNAVLHFAKDLSHFSEMFNELLRILKPGGSLFIRMASNFGMENNVEHLNNGVYKLPDGSTRFLLTEDLLQEIKNNKQISFLEAIKTTIVEYKRCMTTLVIKKNNK